MTKPARILIAALASMMAVAGFVAVGYSFIYHPVSRAPQTASVAPVGTVAPASAAQPSATDAAAAAVSSIISSFLDEGDHGDD